MTNIPSEWYFVTAPQSVSWSKDSRVNVVEPYGTNNPYVHYGTTKLRSLSLSDSLVEGFSDGNRVVEDNLLELEACMKMVLDAESGFAAPYCWEVYAGGKSYGVYIITNVNTTEEIRTPEGLAVRAKVDISFQEVSPYQVSSGIDITADALSGKLNPESEKALEEANKNNAKDQEGKVNDKKDNQTGKNDPNKKDPSKDTTGKGVNDDDTPKKNVIKPGTQYPTSP